MTATPDAPKPRRRQMNVRLPEDLIDAIDARRSRKDLSRDVFVERALRFALDTAPPAGARPGRPARTR